MREIGIKIFPNGKAFYEQIEQYIDFVEIMAIEGAEYSFLKGWKKSVVIHHEYIETPKNLKKAREDITFVRRHG